MLICISLMVVLVICKDQCCVCIVSALICFFLFGSSIFGDAYLCYEVVCRCVIENVVLARCEVFFW